MNTAENSSSKYTILVVDGQVLIQDFIKACLEDIFHVVSAYSAEQAMSRLNSFGPFDVVISSLSLTGMNGLEFLSKVHGLYPHSVRILMSGSYVDHAEISHALEEGHISRFLLKPFSPSALKNQLKKDLDSIRPATARCNDAMMQFNEIMGENFPV